MRGTLIPDLPIERPKNRREAREQIIQVYAENKWDARDIAVHQHDLGLEEKLLSDRTNEEYKTILDAFERSRMIIYRDVQSN
jgi:hypothetical protein